MYKQKIDNMILRRIFIYALLLMFIAPISGQRTEGSNIVSRTRLLSDGTKKIEQRVYDNGLGDVVQGRYHRDGSGEHFFKEKF